MSRLGISLFGSDEDTEADLMLKPDLARSSTKNHHYTHPIITHEWSFLPGEKSHYHTMKSGQHVFPFNFTFPGNLPSTIRTYLNDANITYKLKATAHRSAFQHNFHAARNVVVLRGFTNEALEYNQTLEIENTWPGKVMYCLTLPHKAYAAGDEIPVSVKFMPLAKGTRVTQITSVIKEYTLVHTRHSSHPEVRVAQTTKHELREGRAFRVTDRGTEAVAPAHHYHGHGAGIGGGLMDGMMSAPPSAPPSPRHGPIGGLSGFAGSLAGGLSSGAHTPMSDFALSRAGSFANLTSLGSAATSTPGPAALAGGSSSASNGYFGGAGRAGGHAANATPGPGPGASGQVAAFPDDMRERGDEEDVLIGDDEIDTMITIPVPAWTTPSHNIHPVFVTHKIKWSCAISNPDGHVSELRCALPIHILPNNLLEEAQTATSSTRALLFGGNAEETTHVDLPSYNDHVYDRIANANNPTPTSGYVSTGHRTPNSGSRTPGSAGATPAGSRAPSRPGSPVLRPMMMMGGGGLPTPGGIDITDEFHPADDIPPRPELGWADSELMMSLGALAPHQGSNPNSRGGSPHDTPPDSRGPSRPTSRLGFRSGRNSAGNSRAGSRASSPERPSSSGTMQPGGANASSNANGRRPLHERRPSGGLPGGIFNLASVKPFTAMMGKATGSHSAQHSPKIQPQQSSGSGLTRNGFSLGSHAAFTGLAEAQANERQPGSGSTSGATTPAVQAVDPLSQVPSYEVARVGFLGGGVTPLSAAPPDYADSDRFERARSETDLTLLARDQEQHGANLTAMLESLNLDSANGPARPDSHVL